MAEKNPNQSFDNYAKEFALRIELLRAIGEFDKAEAEAGLTKAKTLDQLEQTRTTRMINDSLRRSLIRIERAERDAERDQRVAERKISQLNYLSAGIRPQFLSTFDERLDGISWLFARPTAGEILFEPFPATCRARDNWYCLSTIRPQVLAVPDEIINVLQLADWMRKNLHFYVAGSAVHRLFAKVVATMADAQKQAVADLQAKLDAVRKGQFDKMTELRKFLNISE